MFKYCGTEVYVLNISVSDDGHWNLKGNVETYHLERLSCGQISCRIIVFTLLLRWQNKSHTDKSGDLDGRESSRILKTHQCTLLLQWQKNRIMTNQARILGANEKVPKS